MNHSAHVAVRGYFAELFLPSSWGTRGWTWALHSLSHLAISGFTSFVFFFYWIFYVFTFQMFSPFPVSPLEPPYPIPPTLCFYEGAPSPTHSFPLHGPGIPLHWGVEPWPLLLMPDNAILCYICGWSHGSLYVYSLVGDLVPGNSGRSGCLILFFLWGFKSLKLLQVLLLERKRITEVLWKHLKIIMIIIDILVLVSWCSV